MVRIELTERQAENLKDIVDSWIDGHEEATEQVTTDPSLSSVEQLLEAVDAIQHQFHDAVEVRQQLWIAIRGVHAN